MGNSKTLLSTLNNKKRRKLCTRAKIKKGYGYLRLSVFKSNRYFYAQLINDEDGITVASASTLEKALKVECGRKVNKESAKAVGKLIISRLSGKDISNKQLVFDKGPYRYAENTVISKFVEVLRESGLNF
ncbi:50S ribosomal protein L18 [Candidatus Mesenet endosymbiont of Agriotes lineatus]|uniref:50S ribosomal protein L18 n=1 Tax=Candidatus Mesenet endosymbiont of Agriotes lineatus TaxID=3077948 RepID=UPI0030D355E9